jgi:hypothetical protein
VIMRPVLPVWSTALLSVARYYLVATSVGSLALFAGGVVNGTSLLLGNCLLMIALGREFLNSLLFLVFVVWQSLAASFIRFRWPF